MAPTVHSAARTGATGTTARAGEHDAQRAQASLPGRLLARCGLAARAVVYLVLAYLTAEVTAGSGATNASSQGALGEIARQPAGAALVSLLAGGFFAYAAWRLLQAAAGDQSDDRGTEVLIRLGWAAIGALYVGLGVRALVVVIDSGATGTSNSTFSASKVLLSAGGPALLGAVGVGVAAGGIALSVWAVGHDFTTRLNQRQLPQWLLRASRVVETAGNAVRGLVFAGIGASMVAAAVASSAKEAKGLNGELHSLSSEPYGVALLVVATAGFVAFGLASLLEALYRNVEQGHG